MIVRVYRSLILGESLRIYPPTLVALEALYMNVVKTHLSEGRALTCLHNS